MLQSAPYFDEDAIKHQFFVYNDTELVTVLDYDPLKANKRLEMALKNKDAVIAGLHDQISDLQTRINGEISKTQDAIEKMKSSDESYSMARVQEAEARVKLRKAMSIIRNIVKYGRINPH